MKTLSKGLDVLQAALRAYPLFEGASDEVLEDLARSAQLQGYAPGEVILSEQEPSRYAYALTAGSARVFFTSPSGARVMAKLFVAPAFFGEMEVLLGIPRLETVDVIDRAEVIALPKEALLRALRGSNPFCLNLLTDVCARLCVAARNQYALAFAEVEQRLASYLVGYAERFGRPVAGGLQLVPALTQQDLSDALGATARSIQRTMMQWKGLGLISGRGRRLVIPDLDALRRVAHEPTARIDHRVGEVFGASKRPARDAP
jgi:CRP-like cAMP-binding protein